ncbi:large ribosomal subunit protein uL18y-like [Cryptomeria japonica]|uniref:large ribosomal subunit protein uL18y-like n=1 Tax=Cryptomeria japonica TaxID=3369 RepID=UPI0027DA2F52|nr:large ribosomal subunit protein uL18y-like [Cryptomeria japonica]
MEILLINYHKNKYNTPKYRFVVRFSDKDIVSQIIYATLAGAVTLATAYSHKLSWSILCVTYHVGPSLARQVLKQLEMDDEYVGSEEATGEIIVWSQVNPLLLLLLGCSYSLSILKLFVVRFYHF